MTNLQEKPIVWLGSSKKELLEFPEAVVSRIGYSLGFVQMGFTPDNAKPLHGLGSGVWELVEDHDGNAYRGVYAVRFGNVVYVLHCFQKKAKRGRATPKVDMDLIRRRLAQAQADYEDNYR